MVTKYKDSAGRIHNKEALEEVEVCDLCESVIEEDEPKQAITVNGESVGELCGDCWEVKKFHIVPNQGGDGFHLTRMF